MVKVREDYPQLGDGRVDVVSWSQRILADREGICASEIVKACHAAESAEQAAHRAQNIWSQDTSSFLTGLEMAEILSDLKLDQDTLVAAILYRAVREGAMSIESVEDGFGAPVSQLITGVLRMAAISSVRTEEGQVFGQRSGQADKTRKMLISLVNDVRVALIKLAERTCAIRAVKNFPGKRERVAREIANIYAPLAHRLGIGHIKWELEDLSFRYLEPDNYTRIARLLDEKRIERDSFIKEVVGILRGQIAELGIKGDVAGRAKHIYSIWRKMQRKNISFSQVYDIRAVRILVPSVQDCYAMLGIVHTLWRNIPNEFDDYIANPKHNGYRSLHTAVIGPHGKVLEVQIRTFNMHDDAEFGVCAHWQYKGADNAAGKGDSYEEKIAWLRQVLEWHDDMGGQGELDSAVEDIVQDRIYVFTPDGHVVDLVHLATPLDFAYHIHTEVGHRCRGAKVNGRIVPLTHTLQTGDQVEILTSKEGGPSRDWLRENLGFYRSPRTRSKIQYWFRLQNRDENIAAGRALIEREFKRLALTSLDYKAISQRMHFQKVDDMYAAVGAGDTSLSHVMQVAQHFLAPAEQEPVPVISEGKPSKDSGKADNIHIEGVGKLLTQFARCCKPVPGDDIVGYITQGRGVSIHRSDCAQALNLKSKDARRMIEVSWGGGASHVYPVDIHIEAYDRQGLLRDITGILTASKINVLGMNTRSDLKHHTANMTITVEIREMPELSRLFDRIGSLPNVISVERERA
ncbi:MAG TPA: GTP diphosphokinase [Pseudomonadales bacterium]|nr:GTP diphosphokinase [Pseudomonadales bacterium]